MAPTKQKKGAAKPLPAAKKRAKEVHPAIKRQRAAEEAEREHMTAVVPRAKAERAGEGQTILYTPELAAKLHELIVSGTSLRKIGMIDGMPSVSTLVCWTANKAHPFAEDYRRAKLLMAALYEEDVTDIADTPATGTFRTTREDPKFGTIVEMRQVDMTAHRAMRIAARQWVLSVLLPGRHGKNATATSDKPNEQLDALFASLRSGPAE